MTYDVTVKNKSNTAVFRAEAGSLLADALSENGFAVPAACGRRGTCNKCAVKVLSGTFENVVPDENGCVKSCKAVICSDAVIEADFGQGSGLTDFSGEEKSGNAVCGIAVDIGTTTLAAMFVKKDGTKKTASRLNPQSAFGADVISRISACKEGHLAEQTTLIRNCIPAMMTELDPDGEAEELVIAGNTTMLHLFCGVSPEKMGVFPFTPEFTDARFYTGEELGFKVKKVTVLPSVSAFIGSDITAGIYALGLHKTDKKAFLADLGTNGELVFSDGGKLTCTSTAAGPALEGACIECGAGGVSGAINRVYKKNGAISFTTVGNALPVGICGAGLTDAVALMLEEGAIDETGYLEDDFYIADNVYLTPKDIRQFQLAKSAVRSGIEILLDTVGVKKDSVDNFYIAGGMGYYMLPESAFRSGILPRFPDGIVTAAGNTSLQGAVACIGAPDAVEEMREITKNCVLVDLGGNPGFSALFAENMMFEE